MTEYDKALKELTKRYGTDRVGTLKDFENVQVVSTGSASLDFAIGKGGIPVGRIVEIFGAESVGKTSLTYYMINEQLKAFPDKLAAFVNIEGSFDPIWLRTLVPDIDEERLIVFHPDPGMQSAEMIGDIVNEGIYSIVVFDSLGAMLGDKERQPGEAQQAGGQSRLITHLAKLTTVPADRSGTTVVLVNQVRDVFNSRFPAVMTPGGRAVKHQAAIRIKMKRGPERFNANLFGEDIEVGFRVAAEVYKNKAAAPNMVAAWNFYNRPLNFLGGKKVELDPHGLVGIDRDQELMDLAINYGIVARRGAYYYHDLLPLDAKGEHKMQGSEGVFDFLRSSKESREQIRRELMDLAQSKGDSGYGLVYEEENNPSVK